MYTGTQTFQYQTPPAIGAGLGYSLKKSPKFTLLAIDKYGANVNTKSQFSSPNDLYYNVDVLYPNGTVAPSGLNFETGLKDPSYTFSYEKNTSAFYGYPQREYSLVFKLSENSPSTTSSGQFSVYHNAAQVSGISGVIDGTLQVGDFRYKTGSIDINLSMLNNQYYSISKFEIYTGSNSGFPVVTGSGSNMLKSITVFEQKEQYTLTINNGEQQSDGLYYFYKILPYDDFGSGALYSSPSISGQMYVARTPAFSVNNVTGKSIVLLNDGAYSIQTYHSGTLGSSYGIVDVIANISGNMITGGWYNEEASGDFAQNQTYNFKTIKYLAQTVDGTGNVSNREILITDNSTSMLNLSRTGILYSEYAVSDNSQSAQFLVSGSGYASGSGYIFLLGKVNYPSGSYKLLRTIL